MHAADFNPDSGTVTVRDSKAGRPCCADRSQDLFAALTAGQTGEAPIFTRADRGVWRASHQLRPIAEACKNARVSPAISFHVLRHVENIIIDGVPR